tara:strand:- start:280 stop:492 length:213 start_codon:yes stop_codon:yes gene_type:complete
MGGKLRCTFCNKKMGIISFPCNCGGIFCPLHRYTHSHNCPCKEEKKKTMKEDILKQNPKMKSTTLKKIND